MDPDTLSRVRPATEDDIPPVVAMCGRFLRESEFGKWVSFEPEALVGLMGLALKIGCVFVAEENDLPVGFIAGVALPHPFSGVTFAEELAWWVDPEHRRSGLGPLLLAEFEAWAKAKGARFAKMVAPAGEPGVGRYYRHCGYAEVETHFYKRLS